MLSSLVKIGAVAVVLALAAAAPAAADSIAYVKDGDVWLATPDGSRQQRITRTGVYSYVSQADTGEMIALAPGERLHKLSRTGKVLADFPTVVSDGAPQAGPVNRFHGPFNPEISPDGTQGRVRVDQRQLLRGHRLLGDDRPALLRLQPEPGRRDHARGPLHRLRGVRPDDRLDLPALDVERHAAAVGLRRGHERRRGLHDRRRRARRHAARPVVLRRAGLRRRRRRAVARPADGGRHRRPEQREAARLPHADAPVRRAGLGPHAVRRATSRSRSRASSSAIRSAASSRAPASRPTAAASPTASATGSGSPARLRRAERQRGSRSPAAASPTGAPPTSRRRGPRRARRPCARAQGSRARRDHRGSGRARQREGARPGAARSARARRRSARVGQGKAARSSCAGAPGASPSR